MTGHPEDSSCDLPGAAPPESRRYREYDGSAWDGVTPQVYKLGGTSLPGSAWRDVVRHTLIGGSGEAMAFQLRYFEIGPDGYSSLEKHRHVHAVIVLRGTGQVVVGCEVFDVAPFDLVYIPSDVPHQFVNPGREPFGFLCPVDVDRDLPQPLTAEELRGLLADPKVRAVVRIQQTAELATRDAV